MPVTHGRLKSIPFTPTHRSIVPYQLVNRRTYPSKLGHKVGPITDSIVHAFRVLLLNLGTVLYTAPLQGLPA